MLGKTKPTATPIGYAAVAIVVAITRCKKKFTLIKPNSKTITTYLFRTKPIGGKSGWCDCEKWLAYCTDDLPDNYPVKAIVDQALNYHTDSAKQHA